MIKQSYFVAKGINLSSRLVDGSSYVYLEDRKQLLELNEVGSFIWEQINGARKVSEIIENCLKEYEGNKKEISLSVKDFLGNLLQEKMIKVSKNKFKGVMSNV